MADEIVRATYGFASDEVKVSNLKFGAIFGNTKMTKFEYITNAGKEGAPMEALDIIFNINGTDKSYRLFPITKDSKLYSSEKGKTNEVLEYGTMAWKVAYNEAIQDFSAKCIHIMKCFVDEATVKQALATEIKSFRDYAAILMKTLPKDFADKKLDIFLQWQWKISDKNDKTFLEIPTKLKYGKFVVAAEQAFNEDGTPGEWKAEINDDGLHYKDGRGNRHTFGRNKWFMDSNYATQQKEGTAEDTMNSNGTASTETTTDAADSGETGW